MRDEREPPHGVTVLRNILTIDQCQAWTEFCRQQAHDPLDVYTLDENQDRGITLGRSSNRVTDRVQLGERQSEMDQMLGNILSGEVSSRVGRDFSWFERPQVLRYEPGGYFKKHADSEFRIPGEDNWIKNIDRDISVLLYLNDDFEGGDLLFNHFNYFYRPQAGDLVFFPSDHRYEHEARPLKSGVRFVVVSWAAFKGEPRSQTQQMHGNIKLG